MSKKTKEEAEKTRRRILASALVLFSRRGYDRTTFNDIAARLKLTKGAIYWHFESKDAVLIELVRLALERFHRQIESVMPEGELSFPLVAEMMVKNAAIVVSDPRAAAFFRLMKCQIHWEKKSMSEVRADLMNNAAFGPKEAFREAIANDVRRGRVSEAVDAEQISTVAVALWDGLVQMRLEHFLTCDLEDTLRKSYEAIWLDISGRRMSIESNKEDKSK